MPDFYSQVNRSFNVENTKIHSQTWKWKGSSDSMFFLLKIANPKINFQKSWNLKLFSGSNKHHDTISILGLKQATSTLSNAPSTISIRHPQLARSAPKVASWMQNSKFWKSWFLNFLIRPIESSVQEESSSHPYYQTFLWSHTLGPALSNALSITFIRHL